MKTVTYSDLQLLLAASRLALQKLEEYCPNAPEFALLLLAIGKAEGRRRKGEWPESRMTFTVMIIMPPRTPS